MQEYVLFADFPYDFAAGLPLNLGRGVKLARPGPAYAAIAQDDQLGPLLVPDYVGGLGQVHVCLMRKHTRLVGQHRARGQMFLSLTALRMVKPFPASISSAFTLDRGQVQNPGRYFLHSLSPPTIVRTFDAATVAEARRVHLRLARLTGRALQRIRSALLFYDHVSSGQVRSWQLAMLGIIASLEGVFPQPRPDVARQMVPNETYGKRLARRVATFLPPHLTPPAARRWIERIYTEHRNGLAHGFHATTFGGRGNAARTAKLHRLLEIARLTLLGMLGKTNGDLAALLPVNANTLVAQQALDAAGVAPPRFLTNQRCWA